MQHYTVATVALDHPDAVRLSDEVQAEYRKRFGHDDTTPLSPSYFAAPNGLFLVAYRDGAPVASGGWRAQDTTDDGYLGGDAEVKRMYVVPEARGRGLARRILGALEESARSAGRRRMVLETGDVLPEAVRLYQSSGYLPTTGFGFYRDHPDSRFFQKPL
ncbi:GNAT family N-acetyltransferase [Streptomyces sp. NPDC093085]|uniref:GNAT family N-acetyltransferase n=1 Tax=Streptomyces sp. NPDC093085 TaxID=3155068 RepID=UPI003436BC75